MLNKGRYNQSYDFSSSHVLMWVGTIRKAEWKELMLSNCGARETLQSPLDRKEIKPVNPKGNQPWIFIRTEAKAPILWPPNANSQKTLMLGKTEGRRGWERMRWVDDIIDSMDTSLSKLEEIVKEREAWHAAIHGVAKSQTRQRNWITG